MYTESRRTTDPVQPRTKQDFEKMENLRIHNNLVVKDPADEVNNENAQVLGGNLLGDALKV